MTLKKELENKLVEINDTLNFEIKSYDNVGVLSGLSGIILFKFYYSKYLKDETLADEAVDIISACFSLNGKDETFTFSDGIAGLGWVLDHLELSDFVESENDSLFSDLDGQMYNIMVAELRQGNYDFLHGAIGVAMYFFNRFRNTNQDKLKKRYCTYLLEFIELIGEASEKESTNEFKWLTLLDYETKETGYNFSLSHGVTSIIGFLIRLHKHNEFRNKCEPILKGAVDYILKHKNNEGVFLFPISISKEGARNFNGRLAWCYGDLGIGLQLWYAAKTLNYKELEKDAIAIFNHCSKQRLQGDTLVVDASICHGSFGIAHIFNKLYSELKKTSYKEAADFWIQDGLNKAIHSDGFAGYKQWHNNIGWVNDISLLEGIAGIGLVILDYLSDQTNHWDECLMIS